MGTYVASPTSRNKIRQITNFLRNQLELTNEVFFPVVEFLELGLPQIDPLFEYEIVPEHEMPNRYAVTYPEENKIVIRQDVYERALSGVPRDRFTVAHEIGHYIMHRPRAIQLARDSKNGKSLPKYRDPEWQANTFAGELLAPPHIIRGMSELEIIRSCGVSAQVCDIQKRFV